MKILAAIFDLDGTVIESEKPWGEAFVNVLKTLGISPESQHPEVTGVSVKDNWKLLTLKYGIKTTKTPEELEVLTYLQYQKYIPEINLREGATELIMNLKDSGVEVCLATSTNWEITEKVLKSLKIEGLFDSVTTGEEVLNPKPDPEIFIKAAEKINLEPEACLVFEDSYPGVKAGKEAGMKVIAIDPTGEVVELEEADLVVGSFSEVTPKAIDQL